MMTLSVFTKTTPRIVGLTGGIASGKSLACTTFASLGVPTLDIDLVARAMHQDLSHPATRARAAAAPHAMTIDGALRRGSLRTLFARDELANAALKEIFRPYVQQVVQQWTGAQSALYVVWEAALLADLDLPLDRILIIDAPPDLRTGRLLTRNPDWSRSDAEHLITVHAATPTPPACPTDILANTGGREDLSQRVLGADLAILGQDPQQYAVYTAAVRQEYKAVPDQVYREHRKQALRTLRDKAERAELFTDAWFASLYSERARENLERELHSLE